MITRRSLLAAIAAPVLAPFVPASSDDTSKKPDATSSTPTPSTDVANGYREIIQAWKRLEAGKLDSGAASKLELTDKRAFLANPACQESLTLIRQAVAKPITPLRLESFETLFIEPFNAYRAVAQLMVVEIAVAFGDGRGSIAIQTVDDGFTLAHSVKSSAWIGGLLGTVIDNYMLGAVLADHERWTEGDCDALFRLAEKWLTVPSPVFAAMDLEAKLFQKMIARWRGEPGELIKAVKERGDSEAADGEGGDAIDRKVRSYVQALRSNAALRERVLTECLRDNEDCHKQLRVLIANPTRRMALVSPASDANRHAITRFLRDDLATGTTMAQNAVESRIRFQLLGVHAAIRRFRWANDRLPKTLGEMKLAPQLITDPFTAKPLLYKPGNTGTEYDLASAGGLVPGEDGKPDARRLFTLPTKKRKP